MEGRIYDLDLICNFLNDFRMNDLLFQFCHVSIINFLADYLIQSLVHGFPLVHGLYFMIVCNILHFCNDLFISGGSYLCTILPVCLISVVFRGVVASCDHNTGNAVQGTQCKGKLRSRS